MPHHSRVVKTFTRISLRMAPITVRSLRRGRRWRRLPAGPSALARLRFLTLGEGEEVLGSLDWLCSCQINRPAQKGRRR